jgi:hypothetical protein
MPAFRSSLLAAIFGIAAALVTHPGASHAYTPEQQQACTPDAMRLCGEFVPNVDAITACMIQKKAQLSPQCRVYFRGGPEPGEATADPPGQPMRIKPASTKKTKSTPAKKTTASKSKKPKGEDG